MANLIALPCQHPLVLNVTHDSLRGLIAERKLGMGGKPLRFAAFALAAAVLGTGLAGCAQSAAPPEETAAPTEAPSTPPTAEPTAEPTDILFTVTANVRAADGRTISISMAAHAPLVSTDPEAVELRNNLIDVCGEGALQPITEEYLRDNGSTLVKVSVASTTSDLAFESPIELIFGSRFYAQAAIGQGISPIAGGPTCFNQFEWTKSGSILGIGDFENPDGTPDLDQWKTGMYGFFVEPSSGATIEACKVVITEVGMTQNIVNEPGWNPSNAGDGISCKIGYDGE